MSVMSSDMSAAFCFLCVWSGILIGTHNPSLSLLCQSVTEDSLKFTAVHISETPE